MIKNISEMIEFIQNQKRTEKKVSLDRMRKICSFYGNPHEKLKYIHVGGTNGKGSIVSFVKNILLDSGYHVGAYVSPYVICFNERISYDGEYIKDEDILKIGNQILEKYPLFDEENMPYPTFFEFVTLMAFMYFESKKDLDFVVLEVGIGGLLDCTNIVTPLLSVISNVSFDHMNVLGNTLEEIAKNKLGIVKENKTLITIDNPLLNQIYEEDCKSKNAELILVKKEEIKDIKFVDGEMTFSYKNFGVKSKMIGYHQTENISVALEVINKLEMLKEIKVNKDSIISGIYKTFWPGRFQIVNKQPLIIIDGAHNIDGITRLTESVKTIANGKNINIIFAVSKDKEKETMIKILEEEASELMFSSFNYKRSDDPEILSGLSSKKNPKIIFDLDQYINQIKKENKDEIYVFCGSLYFVSELLPKFNS